MEIIDISKPREPGLLGKYDTSGRARAMVASGGYAYLAHGLGGLRVFDLSHSAEPTPVAHLEISNAIDVAVSGRYACVVEEGLWDGTNSSIGLRIIDISIPSEPRELGRHQLNANPAGVAISGDRVYLADNGDWQCLQRGCSGGFGFGFVGAALRVIDISDPAHTREIEAHAPTGWADGLPAFTNYIFSLGSMDYRGHVVIGQRAYYYDNENVVQAIDLTNPTQQRRIGGYSVSGVVGIVTDGENAYVASSRDGLLALDFNKPANPQHSASYDLQTWWHSALPTSPHYSSEPHPSEGWLVYDRSDPAQRKLIGGYKTIVSAIGSSVQSGTAQRTAVSGNYAYISDTGTSIEIADISDPSKPTAVAIYRTASPVANIAVSGEHLFLAKSGVYRHPQFIGSGIEVLNIRDPANPTLAGVYPTLHPVSKVAVSGTNVYAAAQGDGLLVFDISNPASLRKVGAWTNNFTVIDVEVSGNNAYAALDYGVEILDLSNRARPKSISRYLLRGANSVSVFGNYASILSNTGNLELLDVSDPADPKRIGGNSAFENGYIVKMSGGRVFLSSSEGTDKLNVMKFMPFFKSIERANGQLHLSWEDWGTATLRRTSDLLNPSWQDVPGSRVVNLPTSTPSGFFRLRSP